MKKFYVITYESGETRYMESDSYLDALNYAETCNSGNDFTIEEYENENEYYENL